MNKFLKIFVLFISISAFSQSPWTQEKGKFYTQLSFTTIPNYNTIFGDPEYKTPGNISDNTFQFYGEYGITNNTTLIVNLPFKSINYKQEVVCVNQPCNPINYSENSLGNIEIGLKHNFSKKDWVLSGQFSLEANTSSYTANSGIRTGYNAWTFTPLFIAGKSFGKTYFQTFVGANIRTNNYSSNFKIGGEYGGKISKNIWLIGFIDVVKSLKNGDVVLPTANIISALYVNDQEYGGFGFKGIAEFTENFGATAGFGGAFFGNNVAKQVALTFGVYHKF